MDVSYHIIIFRFERFSLPALAADGRMVGYVSLVILISVMFMFGSMNISIKTIK